MNKIVLTIAAVSALIFTGCNLDTTDNVFETKMEVLNHYAPTDENEEPSVAQGSYSMTMNMDDSSLILRSSETGVGGSNNSFTTTPIAFKTYYQNFQGLNGELNTFSKEGLISTNSSNAQVSDLKGVLSSLYYFVPDVVVPGYPAVVNVTRQLVMNYNLAGKYLVHTFAADSFFGGKTITTDDSGVKYENTNMVYRLKIDAANKKCVLIIYECRFSESMPMTLKAIVLENLDFIVTRNGYEVKGTNITPKLPEGDRLTLFSRFMFESLEFSTTEANLTGIEGNYTVKNVMSGAQYQGEFSGNYVIL